MSISLAQLKADSQGPSVKRIKAYNDYRGPTVVIHGTKKATHQVTAETLSGLGEYIKILPGWDWRPSLNCSGWKATKAAPPVADKKAQAKKNKDNQASFAAQNNEKAWWMAPDAVNRTANFNRDFNQRYHK